MCFTESLLPPGLNVLFHCLFRHDLTRASPTQPAMECGLSGHHLWREVDWLPRHFAVRDAFASSCQFTVEVIEESSLLQTFLLQSTVQLGQ